jgi:hypothetical protein
MSTENEQSGQEARETKEFEVKNWLLKNLEELCGVAFNDDEINEGILNYLTETGKDIMNLDESDLENIYAYILQKFLNSPESDYLK